MKKNIENTTKTLFSLRTQMAGLMIGGSMLAGAFLFVLHPAEAADIEVYKSPTCGCCKGWVKHLEDNGFSVEVHDQTDVTPLKNSLGIPGQLRSCHTAKVDGYLIEGHVPAADIARLLKEKPQIVGLATPGMPMGSPGMEGSRKDHYDVIAFEDDGKQSVYASH